MNDGLYTVEVVVSLCQLEQGTDLTESHALKQYVLHMPYGDDEDKLINRLWQLSYVGGGNALSELGEEVFLLLVWKILKRGTRKTRSILRDIQQRHPGYEDDDAIQDYIWKLTSNGREGKQKKAPDHSGAFLGIYYTRELLNKLKSIKGRETELYDDADSYVYDLDEYMIEDILERTHRHWPSLKKWLGDNYEPADLDLLVCGLGCSKKQPLSKFKDVLGSSYNYRGRVLGIIPGGKQISDYSCTVLGRWIYLSESDCPQRRKLPENQLGLPYDNDHFESMEYGYPKVILEELGRIAISERESCSFGLCEYPHGESQKREV